MHEGRLVIEGSATVDVSISGVYLKRGEPLPSDLPLHLYLRLKRMGVVAGGRDVASAPDEQGPRKN